ncbi:MAG: hypothetical protein FWC32_10605 [Firmicutes bacterium]|nr:hypothetical protein [Bacillota bacterium]
METSEFTYKEASSQDLERRWDINIANNPGDNRWAAWKKVVISENQNNILQTFVVLHDNEPIGEGTLIFLPQNNEIYGGCDKDNVASYMIMVKIGVKQEGFEENGAPVFFIDYETYRNR